jgi:hypothetical protein
VPGVIAVTSPRDAMERILELFARQK